MVTLLSVIVVQKWMATVSGSPGIGLHSLEKGSTISGNRPKQGNLSHVYASTPLYSVLQCYLLHISLE